MRNLSNKSSQSRELLNENLTQKLESNRELFKQFECQHLSSEDRLVVYPCALPHRTTMVLQSIYGTEIKTKEVLNVVDQKTLCGYTLFGDKLGITEVCVVVVVNGKAVIGRISYHKVYQEDSHMRMSLNGTQYRILMIGDQDASFQSPHLMR